MRNALRYLPFANRWKAADAQPEPRSERRPRPSGSATVIRLLPRPKVAEAEPIEPKRGKVVRLAVRNLTAEVLEEFRLAQRRST